MILDNKHVQGIYLYSETAEYEKGDFIVESDCIYICTCKNPNTDRGTIIPGKSEEGKRLPSQDKENFAAYPGEKISSAQEYFDYINSIESKVEDKYISSHTLCEILQNAYFGYSESGIISEQIDFKENKYLYNNKIEDLLEKETSSGYILDRIIRSPKLNNAVLSISSRLPELNNILVNRLITDTYITSGTLILRQYTYTNANDPIIQGSTADYNVRYRVQELVDVAGGQTYIRAIKGVSEVGKDEWNYATRKITSWKCTVLNSSLLEHINSIIEYYKSDKKLKEDNNKSSNNFRFRELYNGNNDTLVSGTLVLGNIICNPEDAVDIIIPKNSFKDNPFPVTINIKNPETNLLGSTIFKTYTITLDLQDVALEVSSNELYGLNDNLYLHVNYSNLGDKQFITLSVQDKAGDKKTNIKIKNVYYKEYEQTTFN